MILNKISLRLQLILFISIMSLIALVIASILIYEITLNSSRKQILKETISLSQIIGVNNQSAIAFNDQQTAREILSKLHDYPAIEVASLITPDKKVFANYTKGARPKWIIIRKQYESGNYEFTKDHLELVSDIYFDEEKIAIIYFKVNLDSLNEQMADLIKNLIWVVSVSLLFSILSILLLTKYITKPIFYLANFTHKITRNKDYAARVPEINAKTEIATLFNGFNEMLDVIELRNNEIIVALNAISDQKDEIEDQRDYIEDQRDRIEEQSKILQTWKRDITSSINYAKNIQSNMLLSIKKVKELYANMFVLFKPRDIVSGDFYWIDKNEDSFIFCAADCTGHGVPGAMISVIGFNLMNQIIIDRKKTLPHEILNELDKHIIKFFRKDQHSNTSDDGMDIGICRLNLKTKQLNFAGANNSAYIIRNNELIELTADKHSLGSGSALIVRKNGFTNHTFDTQKGDVIFLYSDGFMDQFGGENGKKFMKKNFKKLLIEIATLSADEQHEKLEQVLADWKGSLNQVDDILIIGLQI